MSLGKTLIAGLVVGAIAVGAWLAISTRGLTAREQAILAGWFQCEECDHGQLEAAVAIGRRAVPTASSFLLSGPPAARVDEYRRYLSTSHQDLRQYQATHRPSGPLPAESVYVDRFLANYDATYRSRAAILLGRLGGAGARRALDAASNLRLRDDVAADVREARRLVP